MASIRVLGVDDDGVVNLRVTILRDACSSLVRYVSVHQGDTINIDVPVYMKGDVHGCI